MSAPSPSPSPSNLVASAGGYLCEFTGCTERFCRKDVMKRHMKTIHLNKNWMSCPVCGRNFRRLDAMEPHLCRMHGFVRQDMPDEEDFIEPTQASSTAGTTLHGWSNTLAGPMSCVDTSMQVFAAASTTLLKVAPKDVLPSQREILYDTEKYNHKTTELSVTSLKDSYRSVPSETSLSDTLITAAESSPRQSSSRVGLQQHNCDNLASDRLQQLFGDEAYDFEWNIDRY